MGDLHITERNHADRLPNTKRNTRRNTTIEPFDAVLRVHVLRSRAHSQLLRPVRVLGLALHLDTDNLDRLIPRTETTTECAGQNLLTNTKLLTTILARELPNPVLGDPTQSESRSPVRDLPHSDRIHTLVDPANALGTVNPHERRNRAGRLHAGRRDLMLGDLDRLHAGAEAHGGVGLRKPASHAAADAGNEVGCAERLGVVFGFGGDKEEDGAFGRGFDPSPGDEALVDWREEKKLAGEEDG